MRREELYLADLVDNARAVRGYLDGVTRERWDADGMLRDAVLYRMMLLGEIASALPNDLRDRHPDVAWRQIRAFRNLAVHKYFGVDWAVVWKIAQEEPSVLEKQALAIITAEFPELAKTYDPGPDPEPGTESLCGRADPPGLGRPMRAPVQLPGSGDPLDIGHVEVSTCRLCGAWPPVPAARYVIGVPVDHRPGLPAVEPHQVAFGPADFKLVERFIATTLNGAA
jgi:uncharacterized protein with HEPN domain